MYLSKGVVAWLVISSIIVIIDGFYILARPETLKGGKYATFYQPYQLYIQYDRLYDNNNDKFVPIVAYLNLAEVVVTVIGFLFTLMSSKAAKLKGAILMIMSSAFVFWKTVIYIWYDIPYMSDAVRNFAPDGILLYYIPNGFWIVCPLWAIYSISQRIGRDVFAKLDAKEKKA